jgi:hypothetical protein
LHIEFLKTPPMKVFSIFLLSILLSGTLHAQTFLVQFGGGLMNYGGDLQPSSYTLNQAHGFVSGGLGIKLSNHFALYYLLGAGKLSASDANPSSKNKKRNLNFTTNIGETSLTLEYNLLDISGLNNFTPYGFAGIGAFGFKPYTFDTAGTKVYLQPLGTEGQEIPNYSDKKLYKLTQLQIPFGFGVKYAISPHLVLAGELGFRKLFTDYLDDVSSRRYADTAILSATRGPVAAELSFRGDEIPGSTYTLKKVRGNPGSKDTYYTFSIKLFISLDKSVFLF